MEHKVPRANGMRGFACVDQAHREKTRGSTKKCCYCLFFSTDIATWTPKVGKIMAFMAIIMGLLFYILLGSRY